MASSPPDPARRTLRSLSADERRLLVRAAWTLPAVGLSLRVAGYERTRRWAGRRQGAPAAPAAADEQVAAAVRMVDLATTRLPLYTPACLPRSVALWSLLRRRGIDSAVVIGVRPGGRPLDAHAWVERDGEPLNESPEIVASFARLERGSRGPAA